ncbi:sigma-70 family RNA polymerase sigma factor [Thermosipho globiformans]|uniref:sigma-70 family RNA polymerase sigma factor n=1 Tax=Thermosipho globiformans TaxID=380685 RepID=UPI000F8CF7F1|nr:FliA/WhiG family RNA polymerase sigma factor [Thermosipho globiformans]
MINKEALVREYLPYIKKIAYDLKRNLPHNVEVDDLIQEGLVAFLQAIEKFDPKKGAKLRSYLLTRVKGAMYDYLRKIDWMPKNLRHDIKLVEDAIINMESDSNDIDFEKIAKITNLPIENVKRAYNELTRKQLLMLDSYISDDSELIDKIASDENPYSYAINELLKEQLIEAIKKLDDKEQLLLSLRFEHELSLKEIGKVLNVTESRVSQLLAKTLAKLKKYLGGE